MKVAIDEGIGFSTWQHYLEADTVSDMLVKIREFAAHATEESYLSICGSDYDPLAWEEFEDCWETYVVPAINRIALVNNLETVEDEITAVTSWIERSADILAEKKQQLENLLVTRQTLKDKL